MPTTATEFTQSAQEAALETVRQGQQAIVEAVKAWATAVEKAIPDAPVIPYSDELPTPKEIVKTSFEFADQLLRAQREFAESILDAAAPVLGKPGGSPKSAAKA